MLRGDLEPGQVVCGRFQLLQLLGSGGFGVVWRAVDTENPGKDVALKLLTPVFRKNTWILERFERESKILERFDHPNIAHALAWSVEGDRPYLALEFIAGSPLTHEMVGRVQSKTHFSAEDLKSIFDPICGALVYAHEQGVVHRDLKPQNIMVTRPTLPASLAKKAPPEMVEKLNKPIIKVLDFGIAKMLEDSASRATTMGRLLGTHTYFAPEQIVSSKVDHRADIFAAGSIFFELLTLRRAWLRDEEDRPATIGQRMSAGIGNERLAVIDRIRVGPRPIPSQSRPGLSPKIDAVIQRAVAVNKEDRFQSAKALHEALVEALEAPLPRSDFVESDALPLVADTPVSSTGSSLPLVVPVDLDGGEESAVWTREDRGRPKTTALLKETLQTPKEIDPTPLTNRGRKRKPRFLLTSILLIVAAFAMFAVFLSNRGSVVVPERTVKTEKTDASQKIVVTRNPSATHTDDDSRADVSKTVKPQKTRRRSKPRPKPTKPQPPPPLKKEWGRVQALKNKLHAMKGVTAPEEWNAFGDQIVRTAVSLMPGKKTTYERCTSNAKLYFRRRAQILGDCIAQLDEAVKKRYPR